MIALNAEKMPPLDYFYRVYRVTTTSRELKRMLGHHAADDAIDATFSAMLLMTQIRVGLSPIEHADTAPMMRRQRRVAACAHVALKQGVDATFIYLLIKNYCRSITALVAARLCRLILFD